MAKNILDQLVRYSYKFPMHAPDLLKEWRENQALSQVAAAERIGVSQPTYSDYERGRKIPRTQLALKIQAVTDGAVPVAAWVAADDRTAKPEVA